MELREAIDANAGQLFFGCLMLAVVCAFMCTALARHKGYKGTPGLVGFLFGIFALIYYAGLPDFMARQQRMALFASIMENAGLPDFMARQQPTAVEELLRLCRGCGNPMAPDARFCSRCGFRLMGT
jgi:hypothetical protein